VRELADLQLEACNRLGPVTAAGPSVNIRVIAASERVFCSAAWGIDPGCEPVDLGLVRVSGG